MAPEKVKYLIDTMTRVFDEAKVQGYSALIDTMSNDPKDRHVLAAAVHAGAQIIVTNNLQDFPKEALTLYNIEAQSPDEFLMRLLEIDQQTMCFVILGQAAALKNPPMTLQQLLATLAQHAPRFVAAVSAELDP